MQEQTENGDEEEEEQEVLAGTSLHTSLARKESHENLKKQAERMKHI
jgi:hypothetical protein